MFECFTQPSGGQTKFYVLSIRRLVEHTEKQVEISSNGGKHKCINNQRRRAPRVNFMADLLFRVGYLKRNWTIGVKGSSGGGSEEYEYIISYIVYP